MRLPNTSSCNSSLLEVLSSSQWLFSMKMRLLITMIVIAPYSMISPIFNLSSEEIRAIIGLSLLLLFATSFSFVPMAVLIKVGLLSVHGWSSCFSR